MIICASLSGSVWGLVSCGTCQWVTHGPQCRGQKSAFLLVSHPLHFTAWPGMKERLPQLEVSTVFVHACVCVCVYVGLYSLMYTHCMCSIWAFEIQNWSSTCHSKSRWLLFFWLHVHLSAPPALQHTLCSLILHFLSSSSHICKKYVVH